MAISEASQEHQKFVARLLAPAALIRAPDISPTGQVDPGRRRCRHCAVAGATVSGSLPQREGQGNRSAVTDHEA